MRILESAPRRYDWGMRLLTLGRIERSHARLTADISPGDRVMDIGCGTGSLTIRAASKGALVKAIDTNAGMLEVAKEKAASKGLEERIEFVEMGVAELDGEADESYDLVLSSLCFSELSEDERRYALKEIRRVLKPGGKLSIADEVIPAGALRRIASSMLRLPLAALTYAIAQTSTRPLKHLEEMIEAAGLELVSVEKNRLGNFAEFFAVKPKP